MFGTEIENICP